jgi:thioredoxin reductase (NADPH)
MDKIGGLKEKRDIQVFVSPTCPYCPQQALSAFSAAIVKPDLVSAEVIEIYENQDLAENLGSLSVPQTSLIASSRCGTSTRNSLNRSSRPEEYISSSYRQAIQKDLVIVGAGLPVSAAIYAGRPTLPWKNERHRGRKTHGTCLR